MKKMMFLLLLFFATSAQAQEACTSKIQEFVDKSGFKFTVAQPCKVWIISDALTIPRGEGLQGLLLIAQEDELGIIGTVVQPKAKLNLSSDLLLKLMRLNNDLDFVKTGIDADGDLFVRAEVHMSSLTAEDFNATVKSVITASTQVASALEK
jgi:Putative bacterial sensory transduction regulator